MPERRAKASDIHPGQSFAKITTFTWRPDVIVAR